MAILDRISPASWRSALGLLLVAATGLGAPQARANGDLDLDCPCRVESDGTTLTVTAGIRNFRDTDSGPVRLVVHTVSPYWTIGELAVADTLAAKSRLARTGYDVAHEFRPWRERELRLQLEEMVDDSWERRDFLRMEFPVDLSVPFDVLDLDYIKDTDGDGVGDVNERAEQTDPDDADSTPGSSTVDLLAFYSQGVPDIYDGDPTTRIQHLVTQVNTIYENAGLALTLRIVGMVPVQIEEYYDNALVDRATQEAEVDRHAADLHVLFRPHGVNPGTCGFSYVGGFTQRGRLSAEYARRAVTMVKAQCSARTLAHELGHAMGLGHSFWQGDAGTWRWSRGHGADEDFGTIMTYGGKGGGGVLSVFSDPDATCRGDKDVDKPCGVDRDEVAGADAVLSLDAVRFQIAAFRDALPDTDGDGFVDPVDDLPEDASDWLDHDKDGVGDKADTDDDDDGVADTLDVFPLDATETTDTDGDGVGDNADAYPDDADESADSDGDGTGDNADVFPTDPDETTDADGDGVGDNGDVYPDDPDEWADTDGDGTGDNADLDADADGVADDADLYPLDAGKTDIASYVFEPEAADDLRGAQVVGTGGDAASLIIGASSHGDSGAAYLVAISDLPAVDAADGATDRKVRLANVTTGTSSWKFLGEGSKHDAGARVASVGDMDGDELTDVVIAASLYDDGAGAAYFVSGSDFAAADAADGTADHTVQLAHIAAQTSSWKAVGGACEIAGTSLAAADLDGDGDVEILVGAPDECSVENGATPGAVYVLSSNDIGAADAADGATDGLIGLANVAAQSNSYKLVGESRTDQFGSTVAVVDGADAGPDLAIGAPGHGRGERSRAGAAYLVAMATLDAADSADGTSDGVVQLARAVQQIGSWKIAGDQPRTRLGRRVASADVDDDGVDEILVAASVTYLVAVADLLGVDTADGTVDATFDAATLTGWSNSWVLPRVYNGTFVGDVDGDGQGELLTSDYRARLLSVATFADADAQDGTTDRQLSTTAAEQDERNWRMRGTVAPISTAFDHWGVGDLDGDGLGDFVLAESRRQRDAPPTLYLMLAADMPVLDGVDDSLVRDVLLGNVPGDDIDGDGVGNTRDRDDDGDGVFDIDDTYQHDPTEWADYDFDGYGDNIDAFPKDRNEAFDTDGDGVGDNADTDDDGDGILDRDDAYPRDTDNDGIANRDDADDDGDGVGDAEDASPLDATESMDTDGDGVGNNTDTDDDGDGVADTEDALPLDATESVDSDGDGVGDNGDAFPDDAAEQSDADGDGTGDNADTDDDNDGVADAADKFPFDSTAAEDTDDDGVPDSRDAFAQDASESVDTDGDGTGDNADTDDDGDGVMDASDLFPLDASRWNLTSLKFLKESSGDQLGSDVAAVGDLDGDGKSEFLIGSPNDGEWGTVYLVSMRDAQSADEADGVRDGAIRVEHLAGQPYSWKLTGEEGWDIGRGMSATGDLTGDDVPEFVVGGASASTGAAYVVSAPDLAAADAADGVADGVVGLGAVAAQAGSWRLAGVWRGGAGRSMAAAPGDRPGNAQVLLGQPGIRRGDAAGTAHLIGAGELAVLDAADGSVNGRISLSNHTGPGLFVGENTADDAGTSLAAHDFDADDKLDVVIGAPWHNIGEAHQGAVYVVGSRDYSAINSFDLSSAAGKEHSYKIVGETRNDRLGLAMAVGDVDGDGQADLILRAISGVASRVVVEVLSGAGTSLDSLDGADDETDGVIQLASAGSRSGLWRLTYGEDSRKNNPNLGAIGTADIDGDDRVDLLIALANFGEDPHRRAFLVIPGAAIVAESATGGTVPLETTLSATSAYELHAETKFLTVLSVAGVGDLDDDGLDDFLVGTVSSYGSSAYLIAAADLAPLDAADGKVDGKVHLENVVGTRL